MPTSEAEEASPARTFWLEYSAPTTSILTPEELMEWAELSDTVELPEHALRARAKTRTEVETLRCIDKNVTILFSFVNTSDWQPIAKN
jgi:hypothetical protein